MNLIPDWKIAWRFLSVQAAVLLAVLSGIQGEVFPIISPLVPAEHWPYVSGGMALVILVLRLLPQPSVDVARMQLELDQLEGPNAPAGLLEMYLGAFVVVVVLLLAVVAYLIWSTL